MPTVRVLLLERDPDLAALLRDFLGHRGYEVYDPVSDEKACELVRLGAVDLVVAESVRLATTSLEGLPARLPVLSLIDMGEPPCASLKCGAWALAKPVSLDKIARTLGEMKDSLSSASA